MKGYITAGIGGFYYVKTPEGIVECKPRGIFRKQITPVAGDEVTLETENGAAVIMPRSHRAKMCSCGLRWQIWMCCFWWPKHHPVHAQHAGAG